MGTHDIPQIDWELTEDYYEKGQNMPELKLEDFMDGAGDQKKKVPSQNVFSRQNQQLNKIIDDVHHVLSLAKDGKTIEEIAAVLNLDTRYVYDIQVSAQGFREDDEIAVAHLVEMSL